MATQANTAAPTAPRSGRIPNSLLGYLLIAPPFLIMVVLIFFPAMQSVIRTLFYTPDGALTNFNLDRYITFFRSPVSVSNLLFTFQVTLIAIAVLFLLCFPLALYLRFSNSRIAAWLQTVILVPLFVPGIVLAYAMIRFLSGHGTVDTFLHTVGITARYRSWYLKPEGIILSLIWENIPFTIMILTAGLRQVSNELIDSAHDVGANNWQIFWRIILPLIQRPALIILSLYFLGIFGSYTIPYLLGPAAPQMMGVYMQQTFAEYQDRAGAETQAVITFLSCAIVGALYVRAVTRQRVEQR